MKRRQRMHEALHWFLLRCNELRFDEVHGKDFIRWLNSSIKNVAAYIAVEKLHEGILRQALARRTSTLTARMMSRSEPMGRPVGRGKVTASVEPAPRRAQISRRRALQALAAGVSGVGLTAALMSVTETTPRDVIATGHVLRVPLLGGVALFARNSVFRIDRDARVQSVHLFSGQALIHLSDSPRSSARLVTPLGQIEATATRFGVLVDSDLRLAVATGQVQLTSSGPNSRRADLIAGQQVQVQPGRPPEIVLDDVEHALAWTQGDLYFENASLDEVAKAFNRFNEVRIVPSLEVASLMVGRIRCVLTDPEGYVELIANRWGLAIRREGKLIHLF